MADSDFTYIPDATPDGNTSPTYTDYAKTIGASIVGAGAGLAAGVRGATEGSADPGDQVTSAFARYLQRHLNVTADDLNESRSDVMKQRAAATLADPEFWSHPVSSMAAKAAGMSGPIAASIPFGGPIGAAVVNGAIAGGDYENEIDKVLDTSSDEDLQKNDYYRAMRQSGVDEDDARVALKKKITGYQALFNTAAGAVAGALGPAAKLAGAGSIAGEGAGIVDRALAGGAEGAVGNAIQAGVADATQQASQIDLGTQKEFDPDALAFHVAQGGFEGGVLGGAAHAAAGGKKAAKTKDSSPIKEADRVPDPNQSTTEQGRGDTDVAVQTPTSGGPAGTTDSVAPAAPPPTGQEAVKAVKAKAKKGKKASGPQAEITNPAAPSAEQAVALAGNQTPAAPPVPEEVAAAAQRVARAQAAQAAEAPTPAVAPSGPAPAPEAPAAELPPKQEAAPQPTAPSNTTPTEPVAGVAAASELPPKPQEVANAQSTTQPTQPTEQTVPPVEAKPAVALEPSAPVTPEVTPPATKRAPQILQAVKSKAAQEAEAKANRKALQQIEKNAKSADEVPGESKGKKLSAEDKGFVAEREKHAEEVFNAHAKADRTFPTTPEERTALANDIGAMLDDAAKRGLVARESLPETVRKAATCEQFHKSIPEKVGYEGTADHTVFLREAMAVQKLLGKKYLKPEEKERVTNYLTAEKAAKDGDFGPLRAERKLAGELKKKHVPEAEKVEGVVAKARNKAKESEGAASEGKVLTGEAKARAIAEFNARQAKGKVEANAMDRAAKPKTPEATSAKVELKRLPDSSKIAWQEGEREYSFSVDGKSGNAIIEPTDGGKHIHVRWVGVGEGNGDPNSLGPVRTRRLLNAIKKEFPDAETIGGARNSGARGFNDGNWTDVKVRIKPPEATSAKVVDRAAKETNTEPSAAQVEQGNYKKATVKWNGLDFAIENPKGSLRKGKDANGREWSVEMPDHYGYIKKSEGADGDQVDAYMGPNPKSEHVFLIHQQDFSGKFDEHKAMLGYDNMADAMQAYDRAFSDGRGFERIKDAEHMSVDEFKQWVKSDAPKKAAKEKVNTEPVGHKPELSEESTPLTSKVRAVATGHEVQPLYTTNVRSALKSLDFSHLEGVPKALAPLMRKMLFDMVGDTPVHVLNDTDHAHFAATRRGSMAPNTRGMFTRVQRGSTEVGRFITLRASEMKDPAAAAHVLMHEAAHDLVNRAIERDPSVNNVVRRMASEVHKFITDSGDVGYELAARYALTDTREFVVEAFSNKEFQQLLSQVPASADLVRVLKLNEKKSTLWDAMIAQVRQIIEQVTGKLPENKSMMEAVLRLGDYAATDRAARVEKGLIPNRSPGELYDTVRTEHQKLGLTEQASHLVDEVKDKVEHILKLPELHEQAGRPFAMGLRTMDQLAQLARDHGLPQVRRVADLLEMTRVKAQALVKKSEPIVTKLYELEKKYKGTGMWEKFTSLVHDETMAGVFADRDLATQTHLGKDALHGVYGKAQHADLSARYKELPEDLKQARAEAMRFFTDQQNAMSLGLIKNRILKILGVDDDALARRIHEGSTTDADAVAVGGEDTLKLIKEAKELSKIEGPYFPLMRRGEYVVSARHEVTPPSNATKLSDNEFEFSGKKAREQAIEFAKQQDSRPTIKSVWVDKNTGETRFDDGTKVTKQDEDAEQRFRVAVQNRHVEFHPTRRSALARHAELEKQGLLDVRTEQRKLDGGAGADLLSHQMQALADRLKRRDNFKDLTPGQKNDVVQALREASIGMLGSTRIQTKRLPRTYVEGASHDLTQNAWEYAQSTAGYLAKLEHQPQIDDAVKAMNDGVRVDDNKESHTARSEIAREVNERLDKSNAALAGKGNPWVQRIMTLSFLDKLFSPAFNIVNSLQPAMVTMPVLSGRYGVGRSFDAISRAYSDVAGLNLIGKGIKDTVAKIKGEDAETNFLDEIKGRLNNPREREMLEYLAARGSIDRESGMEVAKLIKVRKDSVVGKLDTGLGYMEGVARQMPQAIEMMNRAVTALATYRLEMARGAKHEDAMRIAQEHVNNTQGLYSATNAAPLFNHPVAKIALQFKKYGQMMYHLLGQNIGKALKGATPEERAQALKTLAGLATTHVAMAGALGLPTEPFKALLMGANAVGLTSTTAGDVENKVREYAASVLGKTGGEIATKGLPHLVGIDLSSRVGMDSLLTFGEPKSNKDSDVKAWLFDTVAGAPVSLVADWVKGANALTSGDFTKAAELMIPNKFAADSIKAYRLATEGKKNNSGRQTMAPYSPLEAATRAIGFTPARDEETSAKNSAAYSASQRQKTERGGLINDWVNAKPSDKMRAWGAIQRYNATVPRDAKISMGELTASSQRRKNTKTEGGLTVGKRDRYLFDQANKTYNG